MVYTKKILIVEDDDSHLELLIRGFESRIYNFKIFSANNIEKATIIKKAENPDLIITDWRLPDGDGTSLIEVDSDNNPTVPVIIMTSFGNEAFAIESIRLGALDYIVKSPETFADITHIAERSLKSWKDIVSTRTAEKRILKLSTAVEQSKVAIYITNEFGEIEYVNPMFLQLTGFEKKEVIGKNPKILKSGKTSVEQYKELWATILNGNEWRGEILNKKKNGDFFWNLLSITPITENNKVKNFVAISEDITYIKRVEENLTAALEKAEAASRLKSSLLQNMNHELRTPMMGIIGVATMIKSEANNDFISRLSDKIITSGKRLTNTLNSILQLSELESNNFKLAKVQVNLKNSIANIIEPHKKDAAAKQLKFDFEFNYPSETFLLDEKLFEQVLNNLMDNAIKYTTSGFVKIIVEGNKAGFITVNVIDSGIGISQNNIEHIFEDFRQVSEGVRRSFEGTGLGLSIARKMARAMNGDITVKSVENEGSVFSFFLPVAGIENIQVVQTEQKQEQKAISTMTSELRNLLIIEDNLINSEVIEYFIQDKFIIDKSIDGPSAIERCRNKKFNIILCDLNLGNNIDGIETMKLIRKIEGYGNTSIVAITSYTTDFEKSKLIELGFTDLIIKPFDKNTLLECIDKLEIN